MNPEFIDSVMKPFGSVSGNIQVKRSIKEYEKLYAEYQPRKSIEEAFHPTDGVQRLALQENLWRDC